MTETQQSGDQFKRDLDQVRTVSGFPMLMVCGLCGRWSDLTEWATTKWSCPKCGGVR